MRARRGGAAVAAGAVILVGSLLSSGTAAAAPAPSRGHYPCQAGPVSVTVPAGATSLAFTLAGGQGGGLDDPDGMYGVGGQVTGSVPVTPGQTLAVWAGCSGDVNPDSGWAAGGTLGGNPDAGSNGANGGAASALFLGATLLAVAAGGGGGGGNGNDTVVELPGGSGGNAAGILGPANGSPGVAVRGTGGSGGVAGAAGTSAGTDGERADGPGGGGGGGGGGVNGGQGGGSDLGDGGGGGGAGVSVTDPTVRGASIGTRSGHANRPGANGYVQLTFS